MNAGEENGFTSKRPGPFGCHDSSGFQGAGVAGRPALGCFSGRIDTVVFRPDRYTGLIRPMRSPGGMRLHWPRRVNHPSPPLIAPHAAAPAAEFKARFQVPGRKMPQPLTTVITKSWWREMLIANAKRTGQESRCPARVCSRVQKRLPGEGGQESCHFQSGNGRAQRSRN